MRTLLISLALALLPGPAHAQEIDPRAYLAEGVEQLRTRHYNAGDMDWPVVESEAQALFDAQGGDIAAAHSAIRHVIDALGEEHSFLLPPVELDRQRTQAESAGPGAGSGPDGDPPVPVWRSVDGGIGYVTLPMLNMRLGGQDYATRYFDTLKNGLIAMDEATTCGWIVDLRFNRGGNMWPMLWGLDPLLGEGPFGYFVTATNRIPWTRTGGDADGPILPLPDARPDLLPAFELVNADRPLALLLGEQTASSGEMTAMALIGRGGVRSFGTATAGLSTANSTHTMPDGAHLVITVSNAADRTGTVADGALHPDVATSVENAPFAARDWLFEQCGHALPANGD